MITEKDFKKFTEEEFAAALQREVKNGDFREILTWHTDEGIDVDPFYHQGSAALKISARGNDWFINDEIKINDPVAANKEALKTLNEGASSITFNGKINDLATLTALLKEIGIEYIELNFKNSGNNIIGLLKEYCATNKIDIEKVSGCFYLNEINSDAAFKNYQSVFINSVKLHNAGANITQQIGFGLAEGKELIEKIMEKGLTAEEAISKIRFTVAIGPDFFFEIAKLRTIRILWKNITLQYVPGNSIPLKIHAETSAIWLANEDANNNLIRASFQCMSAVLGGADSVYIHPYDENKKDAARLSKNIQNICKEESFLDKVGDISSGAYYIETISEQLAKNAWKLFQQVESKGGFTSQIKNGFIAGEVHVSALHLKKAIAEGRIKVIGVNKHRMDKSEKLLSTELTFNSEMNRIDLWS